MGRRRDTFGVRVIRRLSALGILVGTPESAARPALLAATVDDSDAAPFYGPQGPGSAGGEPGPQKLWPPLVSTDDAARAWALSEELAGVDFTTV